MICPGCVTSVLEREPLKLVVVAERYEVYSHIDKFLLGLDNSFTLLNTAQYRLSVVVVPTDMHAHWLSSESYKYIQGNGHGYPPERHAVVNTPASWLVG